MQIVDETINISLDNGYFGEQLEYDLDDGNVVEFFLEVSAEDKITRSGNYDVPNDVSVVINYMEVKGLSVYDEDGSLVFLPAEKENELINEIKDKVSW